ncbi:MAG: hypothetical protein D6722_12010 [Bacteroidetes bacterium]|nr:MAG: hypothetical protein D6722_12010 [Bacteroidota bacterium]
MATNNLFDQWTEVQKQMMDNWVSMSKNISDAFQPNGKNGTATKLPFTDWYQKQQELLEKSMNPAEAQKVFQDSFEGYRKTLEDQLSQWTKMTNQMLSQQGQAFMPFTAMPRIHQISEAYQEIAKYWDPILSVIRDGTPNPAQINDWLKPEAYQGMLTKLMEFNMPVSVQEIADQATKLFSDYSSWVSGQTTGFTGSFPGGMMSLPAWDNNPFMKLMTDLQHRVETQLVPITSMLNIGKRGEMVQLILDAQREYITYVMSASAIQAQMFQAGQKAMPEAVETLRKQYLETNQVPDFDTFFNTFTGILEHHLVTLFETESYSKLQNDMAVAGVKVKNRLERVMEYAFEGAPFTLRSETDELAKELQSLRRKVRMLEKKVQEMSKAVSAEKPQPPARKTPASRSRKKPAAEAPAS